MLVVMTDEKETIRKDAKTSHNITNVMANFINNALTTLTTLLPFPVDYYHGVLLPRDLLIYKMARYASEVLFYGFLTVHFPCFSLEFSHPTE